MNYQQILSKAWQITIHHRWLWIFGILAMGDGIMLGGTSNYSSSGNLPNIPTIPENTLPATQTVFSRVGKVLGSSTDQFEATFNTIRDWVSSHITLLIVLGVILLVLLLIIIIISIIFTGGLIDSVDKINQGEVTSFSIGWRAGEKKFWHLLGAIILLFLITLAVMAAILVPAVLLFTLTKSVILSLAFGIFLVIVMILVSIFIGIVRSYFLRYIILANQGIFESLRNSLQLFHNFWKEMIILSLIILAISIGVGIAIVLALVIVAILLVILGLIVYRTTTVSATVLFAALSGFTLFICLVGLAAIFNTFKSAVFTLAYRQFEQMQMGILSLKPQVNINPETNNDISINQ